MCQFNPIPEVQWLFIYLWSYHENYRNEFVPEMILTQIYKARALVPLTNCGVPFSEK